MFLRLRNCVDIAEESVACPEIYRSIGSAGANNQIISRAVTASFHTPFLIALIGYSGGGKSYTAFGPHGLLSGILFRLPKTSVQVVQVLDTKQSLGSYLSPDESSVAISRSITSSRLTAATVANKDSSRAHIAILFENPDMDMPYGLLIDVAGPGGSDNIAQLSQDMGRVSVRIANQNLWIRQLLQEVVAGNEGGIALFKRASKLNTLVVNFLQDAGTPLAVRVVICADGSKVEMVNKTMTMVPAF